MSIHLPDEVHRVDKGGSAREPEVSSSTPDRMIRKGEVEAEREGRRVCVKTHGPRHPEGLGLLRRARAERPKLTVGRLAESFSRLQPARIIDAAGIPGCPLPSITRRPACATSGADGQSGTMGDTGPGCCSCSRLRRARPPS